MPYDATKVHDYTTNHLLELLCEASWEAYNDRAGNNYQDAVKKELVARHQVMALMRAFRLSDDRQQPDEIVDVLRQMEDKRADAMLHRYMSASIVDDRALLAVMYFGDRCEPRALAILNRNFRRYPISSLQAGSIATIFGDCRYKPATGNLVEVVDAASMNLGGEAHVALTKIYPEAHIPEGRSPEDCAAAWRRYVAGLKPPKRR